MYNTKGALGVNSLSETWEGKDDTTTTTNIRVQ